jgi:hypothetical protein
MHPARHRALRELGAFARQMGDHWEALHERLDVPALGAGAEAAREVLAELRRLASARDLEIGPAALGAGRVARARPPVPDAVLERNQALRFAMLDVEHLIVCADYVGALSAAEGDDELAEACKRWKASLQKPAQAARRAIVALAKDPDAAIEPLGKAQKLGYLIGWLGEATDRRVKRR